MHVCVCACVCAQQQQYGQYGIGGFQPPQQYGQYGGGGGQYDVIDGFNPAKAFGGARPGWVFRTGGHGLGYYREAAAGQPQQPQFAAQQYGQYGGGGGHYGQPQQPQFAQPAPPTDEEQEWLEQQMMKASTVRPPAMSRHVLGRRST